MCRPLSWIESQKMGAFLSVSKGSAERPWLLELRYNYTPGEETEGQKPVVLVGKGQQWTSSCVSSDLPISPLIDCLLAHSSLPPPLLLPSSSLPPPLLLSSSSLPLPSPHTGVTFDTGGISIKPSPNMDLMSGDMDGAACVAATVMTIADLRLPLRWGQSASSHLTNGSYHCSGVVSCCCHYCDGLLDTVSLLPILVLCFYGNYISFTAVVSLFPWYTYTAVT